MNKTLVLKEVKQNAEKLKLVKLIKDYSKLSLLQSKNFLDSITNYANNTIELDLTLEQEKSFLERIENINGIDYIFKGQSYLRDIKLAQLGITNNRQELIEILKKEIYYNISLDDIISQISDEKLLELIKKIE